MSLDRQLQLEEQMMSLGTDKYLDSVDKKNEFESIHVQSVIKKIILPYAEVISDIINTETEGYNGRRKPTMMILGEKHSVMNHSKKDPRITPDQIAFLVVRSLFQAIRSKPQKMVALASDIAKSLQTNIVHDNQISDGDAFRASVMLIEIFCNLFTNLLELKFDFIDNTAKLKVYFIQPTPEYLEYIENEIESIAEITTVIYPMVHTPCDWAADGSDGGFYSPELKRNIIKRKGINEASGINEEISTGVNLIQSTPWVVNNYIREILTELNKTKPSTLKKLYPAPVPEDGEKPFGDLKYSDMDDEQKKIHQVWSSKVRRNEKAREGNKSVIISRHAAMKQANMFANESEIYFPHDLDYRMRNYNRCMTGLNTQGSDGQKGLISLKSERPVTTSSGARWMAINMANLAGHDKLKLDERYAWTISNEELIRDVVKDPIKCQLWHTWDKPVQGLAAAVEYVKWLDDPETPLNTHVQLDGLCNGVQNLAAITRDHIVAPHVGLVKTELRGDVYQYVCDAVIQHIQGHGAMANEWITSGLMDRSLSKTPVMTRSLK